MLTCLLYREISKPLLPLGKAGVLLVHILTLLCKGMVSELSDIMSNAIDLQPITF